MGSNEGQLFSPVLLPCLCFYLVVCSSIIDAVDSTKLCFECVSRGQCEELRAVLTKRHQDEVCQDRAEQLRMKQETKQREQEGKALSE